MCREHHGCGIRFGPCGARVVITSLLLILSTDNRNTYSDPIKLEMSVSDHITIEIHGSKPIKKNVDVVKEWDGCFKGNKVTERYDRQRKIERVPLLLLENEIGRINREYYHPAVISLGPYHHNQTKFAQAEKYKLITLEEFSLSCDKSMCVLYNKVFEVVEDARNCYIDGSTNSYNDEEFTQMMLRDACFVLLFIQGILFENNKLFLNNEYLGPLGCANIVRDIFLLENQIPFVVLAVLLELRYPTDKGEDALNRFFHYLNYGEVTYGEVMIRNEKVLKNRQPLHLLELYRSCFISLKVYNDFGPTSSSSRGMLTNDSKLDWNYVKRNQPLKSVTELKARGIFLKRMSDESSNEGIKFHSHCCYGELELVHRTVYWNTKAIYLNMIAYEMCAHNANDLRVSTYIRVMKSLVLQPDDVKELRNQNILLHCLGSDEEVVKLFDEIYAPLVNLYMFSQLRLQIENHCKGSMLRRLGYMCKSWWAELITVYFSSPWKTVAVLVGMAILVFTFLQTYFTIRTTTS